MTAKTFEQGAKIQSTGTSRFGTNWTTHAVPTLLGQLTCLLTPLDEKIFLKHCALKDV
jgi:hypothetical protein